MKIDAALSSITQKEDFDLNEFAREMGTELETPAETFKVKPEDLAEFQKLNAEKQAAPQPLERPQISATPEQVAADKEKQASNPGEVAEDVAVGLAQGAGRLLQTVYNGAVDLSNFVSDFATSKGAQSQDMYQGLDIDMLRKKDTDTDAQRMAQFVGEYGAPVAATMALGGGVLAGIATGAGIDFMALDPKQERLSKLLNDKYPELRTTAVVGNMVEWLAENNPDKQSNLEGRFKNLLEGVAVGGAVGGVIKGFQGAIKMSRAASKYMGKPTAAVADDAAEINAPAILQEEELAVIEAKMGSNIPEEVASLESGMMPILREPLPEELVKLEEAAVRVQAGDDAARAEIKAINEARVEMKEIPAPWNDNPVITGIDGSSPRFNSQSPAVRQLFANPVDNAFVPMTVEESKYQARLMRLSPENEEIAIGLLSRPKGSRPYTAIEQNFLEFEVKPSLIREVDETESAMLALREGPTADKLIAKLAHDDAKAALATLDAIFTSSASGSGSSLGNLGHIAKLRKLGATAADFVDQAEVVRIPDAPSVDGGVVSRQTDATKIVTRKVLPARVVQQLQDKKFREELGNELIQKFGGKKDIDDYVDYVAQIRKSVAGLEPGQAKPVLDQVKAAETMGTGRKVLELIGAIARKSMLSSGVSTMSAFIGNTLTTLTSVSSKYAAAGIVQGKSVGKAVINRKFREVVSWSPEGRELFDQANDFAEGIFLGFSAQQKGLSLASGDVAPKFLKSELRVDPMTPAFWGVDGTTIHGRALESAGMVFNNTIGQGEKLLGRADEFWGALLQHAHLHQGAGRKARLALKEGMEELNDPIAMKNFKQESMLNSSIDELEDAIEFGKTQVFASDLGPISREGGIRGDVAGMVQKIQDGPVKRFLFPFLRTGYNMLDYSLQHTVLAPLWDSSGTGAALKRGGDEAAIAQAKIMMGTGVAGAGAYLYSKGVITGAPPQNYRMQQALKEEGWRPYSFKFGETYVSYERLEPMATMLRMGTLAGIVAEHADERELHASMHLMGATLVDSLQPQALSQEFVRVMDVIAAIGKADGSGQELMNKFIASQTGKFSPALLRDSKKLSDPYRRDTTADNVGTAITNMFASKTPWLSRDLAVTRNIWGEPVMEPTAFGPDLMMPLPASYGSEEGSKIRTVLDAFARSEIGKPAPEQLMKLNFSMPSRVWSGGGVKVEMTNEEYERYMVYYSGHTPDPKVTPGKEKPMLVPLKDRVAQIALPIYDMVKDQQVPPALYDTFMRDIQKTVRTYRSHANMMMEMDPEFQARLQKARIKRMELTDVGL